MLESEAFKTYRAYATGEKAPKSKAKGDKPATTKSKGLIVLSEVALSKAEQMKLATKRSMKEFHISHASGSGDGVDLQSKVPDEQQTLSGTNEGAGEDEEEHEEHNSDDDNDDNDDKDDDQENDSQRTESDDEGDDFVHPNLSTYKAGEEEEKKQKMMMKDQEDEENRELYKDLNLNLDRQDAEMTDAQTNQETEEAYVTLTTEPPIVQQQSSSISLDLVAKFINPTPDTGIDSILNLNVAVSVTPSSATIIPQTPILIIQPQQKTHDSTTITIPTKIMSEIPNFASLFSFERRVSSLESDMSALKQTNQFPEALSSILGIVDKYLVSKVKDTDRLSRRELDPMVDDLEEPFSRVRYRNVDGSPAWLGLNPALDDRYPHDLSKPLPLIPDARGHQIIPYDHFINNDLEYLKGGSSSLKYTTSITKTKAADYGKLTNLNMDERFALNVALRMYTRRIVIQERVEDLQLAVESYQKKINLTKPNTYWTDLKKMTPYTAYRDIQGIIYQDDMDRNCLMRTDELHNDKVLKLKNFKKDATLKLFKSTNQERYEHVGPEVTSSQDGKVYKMAKRDYAWLMISRCSRSHSRQAKEQAQDLKSMITTSNHKLMIEVKDYELKTKVEA
ncbi:hypothetical protein Tco_0903709 [Tanacetum coccineum]